MRWFNRLVRRNQMEDQLEKELQFHIEQHAAELISRGREPAEARRLACLALGGPEQVKEECRDARGTRWLEDLWRDFRYSLRTLRARPGFAAIAILTLALGAGATTVMFTVINGVLLKPLPYPDPATLVKVDEKTEKTTHFGNIWAFTYPNYLDCKRGASSLDLAVWRYSGGTVSKPGDLEYVDALEISSGLLPMLGVSMFQGRAFRPEDDRPGAPPVAVISYAFWHRRFAGSSSAVGMPMVFEAQPYTVIGIAPASFHFDSDPDVFIPLGQNPAKYMQDREAHFGFQVWGRLRPGVSLNQAQSELSSIGRHLAGQYPKSNEGRSFVAEPLRPDVGDVSSTLWLLLGAVTIVLLIACVNIASLLLARAVSRERELAMRMALGAGRGRLARQCLTESAVLALAGGILGVWLAALGVRPFVAFWPGALPRAEGVHLDWHVLVFALAVSLASGLLFGLAPALRVPTRNLEQSLRAGGRTLGGSSRLHAALVASEISLAVVLLVSAGLLGRTLLHLSSLHSGLDIRNVLTARASLSPTTLDNPARTRAAWQGLLEQAAAVPGIRSAAIVDTVPLREGNNEIGYWTTPAEPPPDQQHLVSATSVTPDYLKVAGIRLRSGRFFDNQDRLGREGVVVIDEVMAQEAFGGSNPIGRHVSIGIGSDPMRVIGVVDHVRHWGAADDDRSQVRAQLYYPFAQVPDNLLRRWSTLMSIAVRTAVPPLNVTQSLRRAVRGVAGDQVIYEVRTMEQLSHAALARQRFLLLLFSVFASLALLLACIGIYGVLAYLTSRRIPEIGVRMALGADAREVMWLILRQSFRMIAAGLAMGSLAAIAAGRLFARLVQGMQPTEPATFAVMLSVLTIAALAASFLPARRASRVDPVAALRQE